jgi:hypothetical protein
MPWVRPGLVCLHGSVVCSHGASHAAVGTCLLGRPEHQESASMEVSLRLGDRCQHWAGNWPAGRTQPLSRNRELLHRWNPNNGTQRVGHDNYVQ